MDVIEKMVKWLDEKYYYIPAFMLVYLMMRWFYILRSYTYKNTLHCFIRNESKGIALVGDMHDELCFNGNHLCGVCVYRVSYGKIPYQRV